jgi:hypothetical protein
MAYGMQLSPTNSASSSGFQPSYKTLPRLVNRMNTTSKIHSWISLNDKSFVEYKNVQLMDELLFVIHAPIPENDVAIAGEEAK